MKKERGITLIALIVAIIVLLILAGVSIGTLSGKHGVLTRAKDAASQTKTASIKEQVQLAVTGSYETGGVDLEELKTNLFKINGIESVNDKNKTAIEKDNENSKITEESFPLKVVVNGEETVILADGTVSKIATSGEKVTGSNAIYVDAISNKVAVIPQEFTVSNKTGETLIDAGLVVIGPDESEFVWVPVDKNTLCSNGIRDKEIAKLQSGSTQYYEGISYSFTETTSSKITSVGLGTFCYREPSLVTGSSSDGYTWNITTPTGTDYDASSSYYKDILGYNSAIEFGIALNEEYTSIINSIKTNGGFYVGRYEASINGDTIKIVKDVTPMSASTNSGNMWYGMYKKEKEYASKLIGVNSNLKSAMITGSCYDAMLNWALNGDDKAKVTVTINGNHSGSPTTTGNTTYSNDKINNILDLEGNLREWTSENFSTNSRLLRRRKFWCFGFLFKSYIL